jgi:hypothetical protein
MSNRGDILKNMNLTVGAGAAVATVLRESV